MRRLNHNPGSLGRRDFLKRGAALGLFVGGTSVVGTTVASAFQESAPGVPDTIGSVRLLVTDGFMSLPGRRFGGAPGADELYAFGFRAVDDLAAENNDPVEDLVQKYKGKVHHTAPTIVASEGEELALVVTNLGFVVRPDLDDSHTLHWHGFRNATSVFDGVPEVSVAVPAERNFPYYYLPMEPPAANLATKPWVNSSAGTYMYHCHFEDTEHVQMGMTGMVYVRPMLEVAHGAPGLHYAYNDRDLTTGTGLFNSNVDTSFNREWVMLFNEIDTVPHDGGRDVQEFVWTNYKPNYWTINGRSYPDTVVPEIDPTGDQSHQLIYQPNSSLVQINAGERGLLRLANLGYEVHSMELTGIGMHVVGADASLLLDAAGGDNSVRTTHVDIGPGEGRDVIFTAPAFNGGDTDDLADGFGPFNRYLLRSRNSHRNTNNGDPSLAGPYGLGGMVTEVRVYNGSLPTQTYTNETYPTYAN